MLKNYIASGRDGRRWSLVWFGWFSRLCDSVQDGTPVSLTRPFRALVFLLRCHCQSRICHEALWSIVRRKFEISAGRPSCCACLRRLRPQTNNVPAAVKWRFCFSFFLMSLSSAFDRVDTPTPGVQKTGKSAVRCADASVLETSFDSVLHPVRNSK